MARPRKDADAPDARTRIIEAFWELIENNSIFELSVGEVTRSIMMSSTETVFYTMSVYFLTAKVSKTRWTLAGALLSTLAGISASVVLARMG